MKNFRVNLIARVILLTITIAIFFYLVTESAQLILLITSALIVIFQTLYLIKYVDRTNRELKYFLESIRYSDFLHTVRFGAMGGSYKDLSDEFTNVLEKFKQLRNEKEESFRYLETVVQHVGVGLLVFDASGNIELFNRSAKRLFSLQNIKNINTLNSISPNFGNYLLQLPDDNKKVYRLSVKDETIQLLLYATSFGMRNQIFKLVAVQNILPELEEKEIEAYQKLIRVLTHEIMNSVTPISSLASTTSTMLSSFKKPDEENNLEVMEDICSAMKTIQKRSEGLIYFVDKYRSLTKIPTPTLQIIKASELFQRISTLMDTAIRGKGIMFSIDIEPKYLELATDPDLLEQVLINILNNAIQSLASAKEGKVGLFARIDERGRACIRISDNGSGIPEDLMEKIFIPFFSTKKDGSGIGLSISQQIVRSLGGTINVISKPNQETVFTIRL
jgi:two-component system, NtrC family, nitrogen regulation sensor histidine kinase NtrY